MRRIAYEFEWYRCEGGTHVLSYRMGDRIRSMWSPYLLILLCFVCLWLQVVSKFSHQSQVSANFLYTPNLTNPQTEEKWKNRTEIRKQGTRAYGQVIYLKISCEVGIVKQLIWNLLCYFFHVLSSIAVKRACETVSMIQLRNRKFKGMGVKCGCSCRACIIT